MNNIKKIKDFIKEDTSATGGAPSSGMGAVVSSQPSGIAGQTIGPNWASNGGTTGSGDVSVPYNPSGANRIFQNIKNPVKSKKGKRFKLKEIKDKMSGNKEDYTQNTKVMKYNDFLKNDFTTIKR